MGKPSIFSNDYEQRMRRRRKMKIINLILIILIIASAGYFGVNYFAQSNGFDIGKIFKDMFSISEEKKDTTVKEEPKPTTPTNDAEKEEEKEETEEVSAFYEYKAPDGKLYKIEYNEANGSKSFFNVTFEGSKLDFDISQDGKKIVFCSQMGDVLIADEAGNVKKINSDSYRSKSAGITIEKSTTYKYYPEYIWAAKPHFTQDNRVVYLTYLPYLKGAATLNLWVLNADGSSNRMAGKLSNDIKVISYDGYNDEGALKIKVGDGTYYLSNGSNLIEK
jgi:hypothetical protein